MSWIFYSWTPLLLVAFSVCAQAQAVSVAARARLSLSTSIRSHLRQGKYLPTYLHIFLALRGNLDSYEGAFIAASSYFNVRGGGLGGGAVPHAAQPTFTAAGNGGVFC